MKAEDIIEQLGMKPLPIEGGYYTVTHLADEELSTEVLPSRYPSSRPYASAIYYLVTAKQFSAMHKLPSDEIYYFHLGDPMEVLLLEPDGGGSIHWLGTDLGSEQTLQLLAPRHYWQGSRSMPGGVHGFSLVSTSMAPAYVDTDPVFANRDELTSQYPEFSDLIKHLTPK
jgi:predicted cupin superfamily sugar epimerase